MIDPLNRAWNVLKSSARLVEDILVTSSKANVSSFQGGELTLADILVGLGFSATNERHCVNS